jgi:hypothetical protein
MQIMNRIFLCAVVALGLTGCPDDDDNGGDGGDGGALAGGTMGGGTMGGGTMAGGAMAGGAMTGGAMTGGAMTGGAMAGDGPNCPAEGLQERVEAVCNFLADCAISDCAYEGELCRTGVYEGCVAVGANEGLATGLTAIACGHTMCSQTIQLAGGQNMDLAAACMDGAEATTCEGEPDTCEAYCALVETACTGDNAIDFGGASCAETCAAYPPGEDGDMGNDSAHCRLYHVGVASMTDPEVHCPHAGPDGGGQCVASTCDAYCALVETACTGDNAIDFGETGCADTCAAYPPGEDGDMGNNSAHCRLYHVGVASMTDPEVHCPHAGPDGGGQCED